MTSDRITLGLWALGNSEGFHNNMTARSAKNIIKTAYKRGIHSFDSAFSYNTDSLLYSALKELGVKTEDVEIFEKVMPYKSMRRKAEASLRALKCDNLNALLIHWPSEEVSLYQALRDAENMLGEGKCSAIGISNFPPELANKIKHDFPITYNEYFSSPTFPIAPIEGLKNLKYGIFSFGSLLKEEKEEGERGDLFYYEEYAYSVFLDLKSTIKRIAEEKKKSVKEILFSFALHDDPYRIIIGATKEEHLRELDTEAMEDMYYSVIMEKGEKLASFNKSDNIFSHNWRVR